MIPYVRSSTLVLILSTRFLVLLLLIPESYWSPVCSIGLPQGAGGAVGVGGSLIDHRCVHLPWPWVFGQTVAGSVLNHRD